MGSVLCSTDSADGIREHGRRGSVSPLLWFVKECTLSIGPWSRHADRIRRGVLGLHSNPPSEKDFFFLLRNKNEIFIGLEPVKFLNFI